MLKEENQIREDHLPYIVLFCAAYNIKLEKIDFTTENGIEEELYIFDDYSGGYTINGICKSLDEIVRLN